ncbi:bombyxin A-1 homolog [Leptidea sinapis]|uniref:bombyxin A-1 homolog n=1 Tax=Leptidea sinapis TaxID=189913 RepID=UPI00213FABA5|nr:bombyxin A-1 homolog [Leptidea sinapis]
MQFKVAIVVLVALVSTCCCHIGGGFALQDTAPQVYCGRTLARALALLCFDEPMSEKRDGGSMYNSILPPYYKEQDNPLGWPLVTPHKAHGLSRGKRQFVVSECCDKPCSINELLSYC